MTGREMKAMDFFPSNPMTFNNPEFIESEGNER